MYLYHMACHHLTWHFLTSGLDHWPRWPKFGIRLALYSAMTLAVATLSYHVVEKPFLRLKSRLRD
jgi:peptidoglycan/LPS O-acetylase OafA/YrhL